jgi:predicted ATPase
MTSQGRNHFRIVLTGGPGGGKTTAADLFRREIGDKVVVVPETATMLFTGGFPRVGEPDARAATQRAIFHAQVALEDVQGALYPGRVLLCDRGTIDGAAFWPEEAPAGFFETMETTLERELERYDAVIFFESAAVGDISRVATPLEPRATNRRESSTCGSATSGRITRISTSSLIRPRFLQSFEMASSSSKRSWTTTAGSTRAHKWPE